MSEKPEELKKPSEKPEELKKLAAIAADLKLPAKMRIDGIEQLGEIATTKERDLALKKAREVIKKTSP